MLTENKYTRIEVDYSLISQTIPQNKVIGVLSVGTSINYETVLLTKIDQLSDWAKMITNLRYNIDTIDIKPYFFNGQLDLNQLNTSTAQTTIYTAITASTFVNGKFDVIKHNNSMVRLTKQKFESNWNNIRLLQTTGNDFGNQLNVGGDPFATFSGFITNIQGYYSNIIKYNTYNQTDNYLISAITETRKQIESLLVPVPLI